MKKGILILMALTLILASVTAMAEAPRNGGRGTGARGGSMQTLNEGIAYMNGDGVEQDLNKAKELYQEAAEYEYPDAIEALERLSK